MANVVGVEIANVPDVMSTIPEQRRRQTAVMAVAVHDRDANLYAVYVGIVHLRMQDPFDASDYERSKLQCAQYVASSGQKQTRGEAKKYFPVMPWERYRD